jgi:thiol-disulfide isomerase/thioredoxin
VIRMKARVRRLKRLGLTVLGSGIALALTMLPAQAIPKAGDLAPAMQLVGSDGKAFDLARLHGRPTYLNFFASWCGPCRVETPSIARLAQRYAARGVSVVGIDVGEDLSIARAFRREFNVPYPVLADPDSTTRSTYGGGMFFPLHVFIDRAGVVRLFHPGEMSEAEIERALATIAH